MSGLDWLMQQPRVFVDKLVCYAGGHLRRFEETLIRFAMLPCFVIPNYTIPRIYIGL